MHNIVTIKTTLAGVICKHLPDLPVAFRSEAILISVEKTQTPIKSTIFFFLFKIQILVKTETGKFQQILLIPKKLFPFFPVAVKKKHIFFVSLKLEQFHSAHGQKTARGINIKDPVGNTLKTF